MYGQLIKPGFLTDNINTWDNLIPFHQAINQKKTFNLQMSTCIGNLGQQKRKMEYSADDNHFVKYQF